MVNPEWHSNITVDKKLVANCLKKQFPALLLNDITYLSEGWDNTVFLVNQNLIFRVPRREVAVQLIERENQLLKSLERKLPLAIPQPIYFGKPSKDYPYPFHGYTLLPGVSGCHAKLNNKERKESLPVLANFLKSLHSFSLKEENFSQIKPTIIDRSDTQQLVTNLKNRIEKIIEQEIIFLDLSVFEKEIEQALSLTLLPKNRCLIHGDLYCRHILFSHKKLSSVIDWGDAGINYRSIDLGIIHSFYPKEYHDSFFKYYGNIKETEWQHAKFMGIYISFTILLYAYNIKDQLLVEEAIHSIRRINPMLISNG